MAFGKLFGRSETSQSGPAPAKANAAHSRNLAALFQEGITLQADRLSHLKKGMEEGLEFYDHYNESRLKLAFDGFNEEMRKALFELLFLLHVNDPSLSEVTYTATRKDNSHGVPRKITVEEKTSLYVEGAPAGIKGIGNLSPLVGVPFREFVRAEFGREVPPANSNSAILSLQAVGSVGTIGQKIGESDLDLQVIYSLHSLSFDVSGWDDQDFREALKLEHLWLVSRLQAQKKISPEQMQQTEVRKNLEASASRNLAQAYPTLHKFLLQGDLEINDAGGKTDGKGLRTRVINEIINLVKRNNRLKLRGDVGRREALLIERIGRIQTYITEKYPGAEIYMFPASLSKFQSGRHTSSLEFKESSGSAYELILNYETLMPSVQFSPAIPSHFVFPADINNGAELYNRLVDMTAFNLIDIYKGIGPGLVDLGFTPNLTAQYVAEHEGAVYWEAFKASAGNLPKATLNLLRFEMLLDPRFVKTIIQIVKEPGVFDAMVSAKPEKDFQQQKALEDSEAGMPNWALLEMEKTFPLLLQDPWWLRYKVLKIGFGEEQGLAGLQPEARKAASKVIDLAFAQHVRISDAFRKPGDTRPVTTHRDQSLQVLLKSAFPPGSEKRQFIEQIFAGEVSAVNRFENELRQCFRVSLGRIQAKVSALRGNLKKKHTDEVKVWFHYFSENFEPQSGAVQKTILNHLKFPRGRLQVGYKIGEGWFFKSLQRESSVGKRFDTFGVLDHLPDEVMLIEKTNFLSGLAHCIVNGYYGIVHAGTLKERRTMLEFDGKHMNLGSELDNTTAFIRPDNIDRILNRILEFFPYEYHHYTDCIRVGREFKKVFIFLNLWKFGRISFLYKDNLGGWYCAEYDQKQLEKEADSLKINEKKMLAHPVVMEAVDTFLKRKMINFDKMELATWVNPNSVETTHSASKFAEKEDFLAGRFRDNLRTRFSSHSR